MTLSFILLSENRSTFDLILLSDWLTCPSKSVAARKSRKTEEQKNGRTEKAKNAKIAKKKENREKRKNRKSGKKKLPKKAPFSALGVLR